MRLNLEIGKIFPKISIVNFRSTVQSFKIRFSYKKRIELKFVLILHEITGKGLER
jgi:hypothetical protein